MVIILKLDDEYIRGLIFTLLTLYNKELFVFQKWFDMSLVFS